MPRNTSGTFTLSGSPFVTGTVINSVEMNNKLSDVAAALSDSLSRSGSGGMSAPLRTADGTVTAPAHSFSSDADTGVYLAATGDLRVAVGGSDRLRVQAVGTAEVKGAAADGATAVGVVLDNTAALSNAGAKLLSVRNAGVEQAYVGELGEGVFGLSDPATGVYGMGTNLGGRFQAVGPADGAGALATGYGAGAGLTVQGGGTGVGIEASGNANRGAIQLVAQAEPSAALDGDLWYYLSGNALRARVASASHTIVTAFVSANRGDTSQTLTVGVDAPIQRWATTLTANRTITLSTTNAVNGQAFRIVRTGLGAFTLNVGGLKTIPSATAAYVDVMFDGTAWVLTGYGTL